MTAGSYWPHASTLYDYIRRAMPPTAPKSLSNTEVYQVVAYVLHLSGIVERDFVLDASNLPQVQMPNRDGFIDRSQEQ
jgi:cytochrome c